MRIAILGTRGIPNKYGGFEQFAECVSIKWVEAGCDVTVYNPSFHVPNISSVSGVKIRHIYCPESMIGAAAHFIYDFLSLRDAVRNGFDIILECGYQSSAISIFMFKNRRAKIITNMDGLEWQRAKWNRGIQWVTRKFEALGIHESDYLVADNIGIQEYLMEEYDKKSTFIAYGVELVFSVDESVIEELKIQRGNYYLCIARMEPENNIEMIIEGYLEANVSEKLVIIGGTNNKYGKHLRNLFKSNSGIVFAGAIYEKRKLDALRSKAKGYFHGHSVGGTNPSLLEAMACRVPIISHNNQFNKSVLNRNARYFQTSNDIAHIIMNDDGKQDWSESIEENYRILSELYTWDVIADKYLRLFEEAVS